MNRDILFSAVSAPTPHRAMPVPVHPQDPCRAKVARILDAAERSAHKLRRPSVTGYAGSAPPSEPTASRLAGIVIRRHNLRMTEIKKIGVIGAGTMGNGIAQVFAQAGYGVHLVDAAAPALDRARATIDKSTGLRSCCACANWCAAAIKPLNSGCG